MLVRNNLCQPSKICLRSQAEEQVVGVLPGLDDNPFEYNIVDYDSLR